MSADRNRHPTLGVLMQHEATRTPQEHAHAPPRRHHGLTAAQLGHGRPGHPALPHRVRHRRGARHGHRHRARLGQRADDGPGDRLAFFFGYALTLRGILKAGVDFKAAFRVALAADTLSIAVMELIDNGVIVLLAGSDGRPLPDAMFWWVLAIALAAAFVITTPVNKWMIGRGKGHAVVHQYHH